ncbi:MAG TPA: SRPBCC family protein [Opitutaceae bacterium]|nr:SRPBCC family protein [Opitutaceae bacterium]
MKTKPVNAYISYIATTPQKLWDALTNGELTKEYCFGRRIESDWKVGAHVNHWQPDGTVAVTGKVLEFDAPRRLSYTWRDASSDDLRNLPEAILTFTTDPLGDVVRLTMEEFHPTPIDAKYLESGRRTWPVVFSSLKSLLETGRSLPPFDMTK